MKTILEIVQLTKEYLAKKEIHNPSREAEQIIADALGIKRIDLFLQFDRPLNENECAKCRETLVRRGKGEPSQYIAGEVEFYNCAIKVSPAVLIPRPETEILVDKIAAALKNEELQGKELWDVCSGSGCIGIALKKRFPLLHVVLSDLSEAALAMAKENAERNSVEVEFLHGDLLEPFRQRKADYFVCNPPYVTEEEYHNLDREVRDYEPRLALVSGATGLEIYRRLAQELPSRLQPQAKMWMEIGTGQGDAVNLLFKTPPYIKKQVEKDWAGHDRFFLLEIE